MAVWILLLARFSIRLSYASLASFAVNRYSLGTLLIVHQDRVPRHIQIVELPTRQCPPEHRASEENEHD